MLGLPTKTLVIIAGTIAVVGAVVVVTIAGGGNGDAPGGQSQPSNEPTMPAATPPAGEPTATPDPIAPAEPGQDPVEAEPPRPNAVNPVPPGDNPDPLPADWDQLSPAEKTELNPYDCPADENNAVLIDYQTGECLEAREQGEPEPDPEPTEAGLHQALTGTFFDSWQLEVTAASFACTRLSDLALDQASGKGPAEIQAGFDRRKVGLYNLPAEERWELLELFGALEYMRGLGAWLDRPEATAAELWQTLAEYKQCRLELKIKNIGPDKVFADGCLFSNDFDRYVELTDDQGQAHQPEYLGQGWGCTQALVPFPANDNVDAAVIFTLPVAVGTVTITIDNDQPDSKVSIPGVTTTTTN